MRALGVRRTEAWDLETTSVLNLATDVLGDLPHPNKEGLDEASAQAPQPSQPCTAAGGAEAA